LQLAEIKNMQSQLHTHALEFHELHRALAITHGLANHGLHRALPTMSCTGALPTTLVCWHACGFFAQANNIAFTDLGLSFRANNCRYRATLAAFASGYEQGW
jgi:hypothetical protein